MQPSDTAENVLLAELAWWYHHVGNVHFEALKPPTLALMDSETQLGRFTPGTRTLELSRQLVFTAPWAEVVEVLRHEIAHQYVHEVLGVRDEPPHGPTFRRVCRARGIDPRARGWPRTGPEPVVPAVVARARKLLALSASDNPHEAAAAARAAHRLMRRYQLEAADLRGSTYAVRVLEPVLLRIPRHLSLLAGLLGSHFFVQPVWVMGFDRRKQRRGRVLELAGRPAHLDVAAYVWDFVQRAGAQTWRKRREELGTGDKGRRRFLQGLVLGFHEQLVAEAEACEETGLVVHADPELEAFIKQRHRRLRTKRSQGGAVDADWRAGRAEGRRLSVHPGVEEAPGRRRITKR